MMQPMNEEEAERFLKDSCEKIDWEELRREIRALDDDDTKEPNTGKPKVSPCNSHLVFLIYFIFFEDAGMGGSI